MCYIRFMNSEQHPIDSSYTYSQLAAEPARQFVEAHYKLGARLSCKFFVLGLHDNYLLESDDKKYILRIYRNNWRSKDEIQFELELLAFLGRQNARVADPLLTKDSDLTFYIDSPEGQRAAALFHYANGHAPGNNISPQQSYLLGSAVANIHHLSETFESSYSRPVLDLPFLLDESIAVLGSFIGTEGMDYLATVQQKLRRDIPSIPNDSSTFGICIGDVNPTNFHIDGREQITLFDFDQCGYGHRAFEIGKFISSIHHIKIKQEIAKSFISGYESSRPLSDVEHSAIPYFEIVAVIWVMAIHAYNADRIGHKWLDKAFWDKRLATLKELYNAVDQSPVN